MLMFREEKEESKDTTFGEETTKNELEHVISLIKEEEEESSKLQSEGDNRKWKERKSAMKR